jgi:hypothetical protein
MARVVQPAYTSTNIPAWIGDWLDREHLVPGGAKVDGSQFPLPDAVTAVVGVAGAAQNATSVPVAALSGPIPSGTILYFSGVKYARLTTAAAAGATTLAVSALPTALVSTDAATYAGVGKKVVAAGTLIGRTFTERAAGTAFGPAADSDDEMFLVAFDAQDPDTDGDVELYRHGSLVKENFLPNFAALTTAQLAYVRAHYQTTRGAN